MNASVPLTLGDYWHIAVRRKWIIIGSILTALGIAGVLCLVLPKSYRSSTLILVENQKIPQEYVKAIVGGPIEGRLIMIQQQVMSRTILSHVIDEFKLYQDEVRGGPFEDVIEGMRKSIKVDTVGSPGPLGKVEAFSISFAHENPMLAMKVTSKLASQFIEENLRVREQFVEGASEFLMQELGKAKVGLEAQEQTISDFKQKYMGELPQQMEANLRALDRIQGELNSTNESIQALTDRVALIDKAIRDYETTGATTPGVGGQATDPLVSRLRELERTLSALSGYKPTYPDVIQTKQEMEVVKAQLLEKHRLSGQDLDEETIKSFDAYLHGLLRQRDDARVDLTGLKERRIRLNGSMRQYEGRVERTPTREQELMILIRDYDNMQKNYQSLLDKKLNAQVAENLEKRQKGEQFRIIDPANLPQKPEKPDPIRIMLIGLALGCGVGFGSAFAIEQVKLAFRRPEDAELLLGIPLLASIPDFKTAYGGTGLALPAPPNGHGSHAHAEAGGNGEKTAAVSSKKDRILRWSGLAGKKVNGRNGMSALPVEFNLVSKWRPTSLVAEQFRVAATRLALMSEEGKNPVIVISSSVKGEGKSACAVNLGYTLARDLGKTTLLIDCDLKNPSLHGFLSAGLEPGLAEVLRGTHSPEDSIHPLEKWPLWLMPAGNQDNGPVELSKMHQLGKILTELRRRFDYIILDAPPILPLADMNVLASMADILALVIRAETTEREVVQKALNSLKPTIQAGILLTGVWTNGIPYYMVESRKTGSIHEPGTVVHR
jgi:polysaccharide chain length determinant protein (PEP-CTERM system associated)